MFFISNVYLSIIGLSTMLWHATMEGMVCSIFFPFLLLTNAFFSFLELFHYNHTTTTVEAKMTEPGIIYILGLRADALHGSRGLIKFICWKRCNGNAFFCYRNIPTVFKKRDK
jgi:hypothetical protein